MRMVIRTAVLGALVLVLGLAGAASGAAPEQHAGPLPCCAPK
jgi:hypothetical protein